VVYATDKRRKHRLYAHRPHLCSVRAGALRAQRIGDADVNAILLSHALAFATPGKSNVGGAGRWLRMVHRLARHRLRDGRISHDVGSTSAVTGKSGMPVAL
jgi:hypothetical protein